MYEVALTVYSHARVLLFSFGVEEGSLHKDVVRLPRDWVLDEEYCKMPVQERASFFVTTIIVVVRAACSLVVWYAL